MYLGIGLYYLRTTLPENKFRRTCINIFFFAINEIGGNCVSKNIPKMK